MSRIFDVKPKFVPNHKNEIVRMDLVCPPAFGRQFSIILGRVNKRLHVCSVKEISDTQYRFTLNQGIDEKIFLCVLSVVFTIVASQKSVEQIWKDGLENFFTTASQYPAPGCVNLVYENDREVVDKTLKVIIDPRVDSHYLTETPVLRNAIINLDLLKNSLQHFVSKKDLFIKIFGRSDIKKANSLLTEIADVKQEIDKELVHLDKLREEVYKFLECDTLSGSTGREEILEIKKAFEESHRGWETQKKALNIHFAGSKILKEYDIYSHWF